MKKDRLENYMMAYYRFKFASAGAIVTVLFSLILLSLFSSLLKDFNFERGVRFTNKNIPGVIDSLPLSDRIAEYNQDYSRSILYFKSDGLYMLDLNTRESRLFYGGTVQDYIYNQGLVYLSDAGQNSIEALTLDGRYTYSFYGSRGYGLKIKDETLYFMDANNTVKKLFRDKDGLQEETLLTVRSLMDYDISKKWIWYRTPEGLCRLNLTNGKTETGLIEELSFFKIKDEKLYYGNLAQSTICMTDMNFTNTIRLDYNSADYEDENIANVFFTENYIYYLKYSSFENPDLCRIGYDGMNFEIILTDYEALNVYPDANDENIYFSIWDMKEEINGIYVYNIKEGRSEKLSSDGAGNLLKLY